MSWQLVERNLPADRGGGAAGVATAEPPRESTLASAPALALRVADLTKSFRSGFLRRRQRGIEGVSFTVARGQVFALLGHNGAGKTTTINCILGLVRAEHGEVTILGRDYRDRRARAGVGYLPERPYFFEHLSGRELLTFYADLLDLPRTGRDDHLDQVLRAVGLTQHADRRLRKYSKGMLQRLGLAQALLGDPDLLILDEPMSGLDPIGRREVRELLLSLKRRGKTIILSSHIVPDVEMLADAVGVLRDGRLVMAQQLEDLDGDCSYSVNVAQPAAQLATVALPAWAAVTARDGGRGTAWLAADDPVRLRELLDACHRAELRVQAVETRRSGLEELFLQAHDRQRSREGARV